MIRLSVLILSGTLLLAEVARAEIVNLICTYDNGYLIFKNQNERRQDIPKNDGYARDGILIIDSTNKKIIESSLFPSKEKKQIRTVWSDDYIEFAYYNEDPSKSEKKFLTAAQTFTLNRITGHLKEVTNFEASAVIVYRNRNCKVGKKII
jgi:hypothetical protein